MREKSKITDICTIILSASALLAFIWLNIKQQSLFEETRNIQMKPEIIVSSDTHYDGNFDKVYIRFANVGNGPARNLFLFVGVGSKPHLLTIGNFYTVDSLKTAQDYILPNQKLGISFDVINVFQNGFDTLTSEQKLDICLQTSWQYYFSYFDNSGKEYLTVANYPPNSVGRPFIFSYSQLDSAIIDYSKSVKRFNSKSFKTNLREKEGWFKPIRESKTNIE